MDEDVAVRSELPAIMTEMLWALDCMSLLG